MGNQAKNHHWEASFFQNLGNSPASFEASRWADCFGCFPGNDVEVILMQFKPTSKRTHWSGMRRRNLRRNDRILGV